MRKEQSSHLSLLCRRGCVQPSGFRWLGIPCFALDYKRLLAPLHYALGAPKSIFHRPGNHACQTIQSVWCRGWCLLPVTSGQHGRNGSTSDVPTTMLSSITETHPAVENKKKYRKNGQRERTTEDKQHQGSETQTWGNRQTCKHASSNNPQALQHPTPTAAYYMLPRYQSRRLVLPALQNIIWHKLYQVWYMPSSGCNRSRCHGHC